MKFIKEANTMAAEVFGTITDTAKMIRGASKAGVAHTSQWETMAKKQVQQALLEQTVKTTKKIDKLMQKIDADMLVKNKDGYYDLDLGKLLDAHKNK